ncbi:hypothetical protein [Flagellimonas sp. W118]|uniref:hypothetical protein n=1 Tax=Flagellimonas sp. W118 TaxID=3410791 RepID=UPI003BF4FE94
MAKYRIGYIDESPEDVRAFQRYASNHFEVVPIDPKGDIEEMITDIFDSKVRALIVDFDLSEHNNTVHYSGADLVELMHSKVENFPIFILTSYAEDAENKGDDVNIVYEKTLMFEKDERFLNRIKIQIEKFEFKINEKEEKLLSLLNKQNLDENEETEIIKLNFEIEKTLDKLNAKPLVQFTPTNEARLKSLIEKVDNLINKIKK